MGELVPNAFSLDPSATSVFAALPREDAHASGLDKLKAVVIGGGTGASMSIRTALSLGLTTSAVVAMADDGGSTGILRSEAGATTPGDIRKCLSAMATDPDDPFVKAFKVRFGFAENHALGNLMLSALEVTSGSFPEAISICEELLHAQGHVYPSTLDRVSLVAKTRDGRTLEGQAVASHSRTALKKIALRSTDRIEAYEPALQAIREADLVILGPGSLYTSIIANLLVPGIVEAIEESRSAVVFVNSLVDIQGETRYMSVLEHYDAICAHGMEGLIDYLLVQGINPRAGEGPDTGRYLTAGSDEVASIEARGTKVIMRDFAGIEYPSWHDPLKLREALLEVLGECRSARR